MLFRSYITLLGYNDVRQTDRLTDQHTSIQCQQ